MLAVFPENEQGKHPMRYEEMMQEEKKFIKDLGKKETFEFTL